MLYLLHYVNIRISPFIREKLDTSTDSFMFVLPYPAITEQTCAKWPAFSMLTRWLSLWFGFILGYHHNLLVHFTNYIIVGVI